MLFLKRKTIVMKTQLLVSAFLFLFFGAEAQIKPPPPPPPPFTYSINDPSNNLYLLIRKHHHFPGCEDIIDKLDKWRCSTLQKMVFIERNVSYPDKAFRDSIEGIVIISFIAEKDGSITNLRIVHGIGSGCDEEAVRIISRMPKFEIGSARARPLREIQFAAIEFSIEKYKRNLRFNYRARDWKENWRKTETNEITFFEKNLKYPEGAFKNAVQGIVLVKLFEDKNGHQALKIEHSINPDCDKEAFRLVKLMPEYMPDVWENKLNKTTQYIPILFSVYAYEVWKMGRGEKD